MSFETYAAAITLLAVPIFMLVAFSKGVPALSGHNVRRADRPASFWLHLALWVAFFLTVAALLWAQDSRAFQLFSLLPILLAIWPTCRAIKDAAHSGRISGTTRTAQPAAYGSALFGMVLFVLLAAAFAIYVLWRILTA
jgi:hypothetical protein